jgi:hypothetical protein
MTSLIITSAQSKLLRVSFNNRTPDLSPAKAAESVNQNPTGKAYKKADQQDRLFYWYP